MVNSIRRAASAVTTANTIRQLRAIHKGCFLIVEGPDDKKLFDKFVCEQDCRVIPGEGKDFVLETVAHLESDGKTDYLAIVDRDFDHFFEGENLPQSVFATDENDVEIMMVKSDALASILAEHGKSEKIAALTQTADIRDILFKQACSIGKLRYLSKKNNWNLKFRDMHYKFVANGQVDIDLDQQILHVLGRSSVSRDLSEAKIKSALGSMENKTEKDEQFCNGHDILAILGHWFRRLIGDNNAKFAGKKGSSELHSQFRVAFSNECLKKTVLFAAVVDWQEQNNFVVFSL